MRVEEGKEKLYKEWFETKVKRSDTITRWGKIKKKKKYEVEVKDPKSNKKNHHWQKKGEKNRAKESIEKK